MEHLELIVIQAIQAILIKRNKVDKVKVKRDININKQQ